MLTTEYPCFASSSVETCINARDKEEATLRELREGKPCPHFDKCVELTETARKAYHTSKK